MSTVSDNTSTRPVARRSDRHYTGPDLAAELLQHVRVHRPANVADFGAGAGGLLAEAANRWPYAVRYGNDIDSNAVSKLVDSRRADIVDNLDFLESSFVDKCSLPSGLRFSLILLNPPFCGVRTINIRLGIYSSFRCSSAMAFLLKSFSFLHDHGELVSILPTSLLHSELDAVARAYLAKMANMEIVLQPSYGRFSTADASVFVAKLTWKTAQDDVTFLNDMPRSLPDWSVVRGNLSVRRDARVKAVGEGFVHTSSLRNGAIVERYKFVNSHSKVVPAGSVLIPRVGKFGSGSIVITLSDEYISDCIVSVSFADVDRGVKLKRAILSNFDHFRSIYAGTGAPYVTFTAVSNFIRSHV